MEIPVVIEPRQGNGYRARGMEPLAVEADGATQEEALANLRQKIDLRLQQGAIIVPLEIVSPVHPLAEFAGMFKDDPDFEEVKQIMAENRRQMDQASNVPRPCISSTRTF